MGTNSMIGYSGVLEFGFYVYIGTDSADICFIVDDREHTEYHLFDDGSFSCTWMWASEWRPEYVRL